MLSLNCTNRGTQCVTRVGSRFIDLTLRFRALGSCVGSGRRGGRAVYLLPVLAVHVVSVVLCVCPKADDATRTPMAKETIFIALFSDYYFRLWVRLGQ